MQPLAEAIRDLLWYRPPIDHRFWPDGVLGWPGELDSEHPARQALSDRRHLVGFTAPADSDGSTAAVGALFGGQIVCGLPLPGVPCPGSGQIWVIDSHTREVAGSKPAAPIIRFPCNFASDEVSEMGQDL